MPLTNAQLREWKEHLEKVTPGPWIAARLATELSAYNIVNQAGRFIIHGYALDPTCGRAGDFYECHPRRAAAIARMTEEDAAHIVCCDPQTIGEMIEELLELRKENFDLSAAHNAALDEAARKLRLCGWYNASGHILALKTMEPSYD